MSKRPASKVKFLSGQEQFKLEPKTQAQKIYLTNLYNDDVCAAIGSPGTGKTFISCAYAAQQLLRNNFEKIVITRPVVSMGKSNGFVKGDLNEKCLPWMLPMIGVFNLVMGKGAVDCNIRNENIIMQPMEMIRGMSYDRTIVIVDEAQNCTISELKAISTRVGEHSQLILMGDPSQNDLKGKSGLDQFSDICIKHHIPGFSSVKFTHQDIVRSGLVKSLVIAFEKESI